jgi:hypothetical protein
MAKLVSTEPQHTVYHHYMKLEVFVIGFAEIGAGATTNFINVSFAILKIFSNKKQEFCTTF